MKKALITAVAAIALAIVTARPGIGGDDRLMVVTLATAGVTCGSCAGAIEKGLKTLDGVAAVKVDVEKGLVYASYDTAKITPAAIAEKVTVIGYRSEVRNVSAIAEYAGSTGSGKPGCACCNKQ